MARTTVLILLLDAFPEFPLTLNHTLHQDLLPLLTGLNFTLQDCNPNIAYRILLKANQERDKNVSNWKLFKTEDDPIEELRKPPPDSVYDESVFDNSIPDSEGNSIESVQKFTELNDMGRLGLRVHNPQEFKNNLTGTPAGPPFLVAIFESLSNVTAQTCAGTLLSAHWVVTASICLDVLTEYYGNRTNSTEKSHYTIVAGSTNPLVDGSIHNVTEILLRPSNKSENTVDFSSKLAMLKIIPGVAVEKMKIVDEKAYSLDATVYGWTLGVNESGHDFMLPISVVAKKMSLTQCQAKITGFASSSALCFKPNPKAMATNSTKLGLGGPALVREQMLGVVLDGRAPVFVESLAAHAWIRNLVDADY